MKQNDKQHKEMLAELAMRLGRSDTDVAALMEGFSSMLKDRCGALDTIAIPGFGKIAGEKLMEHVGTDLSTGKRVLYPPEIRLAFEPSMLLKTHIAEKGDSDGE